MRGIACVSAVFDKHYYYGNGQDRAVDNNIPRIERNKHNNSDFGRLFYIQGKIIRKKDNRLTRRYIVDNYNRYLKAFIGNNAADAALTSGSRFRGSIKERRLQKCKDYGGNLSFPASGSPSARIRLTPH